MIKPESRGPKARERVKENIKVLFIEDELMTQQLAVTALSSRGMAVLPASSSAEADGILQRESVDVIVCDILMAEENGLSFIRRLRESGDRTPVIFLSALGDPEVVRLGMETGAASYMVKPFTTELLYRRITELAGGGPDKKPPITDYPARPR
jgi:DNA-binding response OmpR family regulator